MPRSCASPDPIRSPTTTKPGRNADTGLQGSVRLQSAHRRDQLQPRTHRPLGVVLVRLRIAEVDEHAVAHVLRHEPAEAAHGLGDALLIGRNDLAQVLGVHARGECRRADEVREHHRDLAALGGVLRLRLGGAASGVRGAAPGSSLDRCEHFPPMPEQDADVLEVLISQMREYRDIDLVLGKALRVLPRPSFSSQSAICCIAATKRISHCQRFWIGGTQGLYYQLQD